MGGRELLKGPQKRFHVLKFCNLVTDRNNENMNHFERYFSVGKFKLNEKKLITLNEIYAIDENKNHINIIPRVIFENTRGIKHFHERYYLYNWSYSTVTDVEKIFFWQF
jgi:hypothetical protein